MRRVTGPPAALALACVFHAVAPLIWVGPGLPYEWDETVYISQVSLHAPAGLFTAPRARGLTILLAPLTELTSSTAALRWYLAVVSAAGLYLAFLPWLRLWPGYMAPVAAVLLSTLWTSIFYGFEAMPNLYVAIGAVASVGYFLLICREPQRPVYLVWLALWLAFTALIRPSDSLYLVAALLAGAATMRGTSLRRRGLVSAVIIAAVAAGWSEWIVEAFVSYGGLARRLQAASAENTAGLHMALGLEARALAGPTLCRPCTQPVVWPATAWWFAVPPLVALGIAAAVRRRRAALAVLPACAGLALLAEYTVTISYAAPRFLLPVYALASIPAAQGLLWIAGLSARWRWRAFWLTAVAAMLAVQLASQLAILERHVVPVQTAIRLQYVSVARAVRAQGVQPPCVLVGRTAAPIAFSAGCTDVPALAQPAQLEQAARRSDVGVLTTRRVARAFYSRWPSYRLRATHLRHRWYLYVHPQEVSRSRRRAARAAGRSRGSARPGGYARGQDEARTARPAIPRA
jgi:hypothetical protein